MLLVCLRMRYRLALLVAAAAAAPAVAAPVALDVPTISTALACYLPHQAVATVGRGFHAADQYSVTLDRALVGTGTVRADGTLSGSLSSGTVRPGADRARHVVTVADGALSARASFQTSAFGASLRPAAGDPRTLRVRFVVDAIGLGRRAGTLVWLHYVDPSGRLRRSLAIGRTRGACGSLLSKPHRLFPIQVRRGTWHLQFDVRASYAGATSPRVVIRVGVDA